LSTLVIAPNAIHLASTALEQPQNAHLAYPPKNGLTMDATPNVQPEAISLVLHLKIAPLAVLIAQNA